MSEHPILRTHRDYQKFKALWKRCRDTIEGSDRVKEERETYLPRLPGQSREGYEQYLHRAIFLNLTAKTLELYVSMIFSRSPRISGISQDSQILADCDLQGTAFNEFLEEIMIQVLSVGRCGVLVDYSGTVSEGMTIADVEKEAVQPYFVLYTAEAIRNWHLGRHGGKTVPDRLVLSETIETDEGMEICYRELILSDSQYRVRLWRNTGTKNQESWSIYREETPLMNGKPLSQIPFFFLDPACGKPECLKPPLLDLVDINLSHYRTMADLEHGRFHAGLPTPVFAGFNFSEGETIKLGSSEGIAASIPEAKAYYLECSGKGLEALEHAAAQKEAWMIQMGAGLLDSYQPKHEAAETLMLRRSGANASIGRMAMSVSETMSQALQLAARWAGNPNACPSVQLTTEFLPASLDPREIDVLLQAVESGNYRRIDWLYRLKLAGILSQDVQPEQVDTELSKQKSTEPRQIGFSEKN